MQYGRWGRQGMVWLAVLAAGTVHAAGEEAQIRARFQQAVPEITVQSVKPSAAPGLYEVAFAGGVAYATADGQFVVQGDLLHLKGKSVVNLSEKSLSVRRAALLKAVDPRQAVVFPAQGKPKAVITVFTDTDCGYCRKLHQEVPAMNRMGVEVRYLAYPRDLPRAGLNAGTSREMGRIWCSPNREQAMTLAKQGGDLPEGKAGCKAPIAAQFALGRELGVRGTPAVFSEKGEQLGGYMTAAQLGKVLGLR